MNNTYLLLGSNLGNRKEYLIKATEQVMASCGDVLAASSVYETAAWGLKEQPKFLNMVLLVQTSFRPMDLLSHIQDIENVFGRQRHEKWGERTLDIDILFYNDEIIDTAELKIPHPYIQARKFTLVPLAEIASGLVHPKLHKTILQLLNECEDTLETRKYSL